MDLQTFLVDNILEYTDRMSMATALEVRVPLLDAAFVEMSLNTPFAYKMRNGEAKAVLVDAFEEFFPLEARHAPKRGFNAPLALWAGKLFDPYFDASLEPSHPFRTRLGQDIGAAWNDGIIDLNFIQQLRLQHRQGKRDNAHELFACIVFDVWWRKYINKSQPMVHWQPGQA
jgi:asparagine synthase (glutamine-hydrolysing)